MEADCNSDFESTFHALQTFSGHPLRPEFLGDADGCLARGFRFFTVAADFTYDTVVWQPGLYFGFCAPSSCYEGNVEVSLAPIYLSLVFASQDVSNSFANLRVQAKEYGPAIWPPELLIWLCILLMLTLVATVDDAATSGKKPGFLRMRLRIFSLPRRVAALRVRGRDRLPAVVVVRAVATCAVVLYHVFFLKRHLRSVNGNPWLAKQVQHVCLLNTSVFSAMSCWLSHRSFSGARERLGRSPGRWIRWAAIRVVHKVMRQTPALSFAFYAYHVALQYVPLELRSGQTYEARRRLCADVGSLLTPDCWNTFANWGILRDFQLDICVVVWMVVWGICGDALGVGGLVALVAFTLRGLLTDTLRGVNLLWSLEYRRLPEALLALIACAAMPTCPTGKPGVILLVASAMALFTVCLDWAVTNTNGDAQLLGLQLEPTAAARLTCTFGFLPLLVAAMLVLRLDCTCLRQFSSHWFWGSLGDQLSLPVILLHNVVFQWVEGYILVGPNWDYPFSWALLISLFVCILLATWVLAAICHVFLLGPCSDLFDCCFTSANPMLRVEAAEKAPRSHCDE